jgi:hypothetical protein
VAGLEEFLPFVGAAGREDFGQHGGLAGVVLRALVIAALDEVGPPKNRPQAALLA